MTVRTSIVVSLLTLAVASSAVAYVKEGHTRGTVVAVGEDRIVVQADEGGQMTFEVAKVKDGDVWVRDRGQMAQLKTIKKGQKVEVKWGQDHAGHFYVVALKATGSAQEQPRYGLARGKVITTSEGRIVIALAEGGQMTLEPSWIRRRGKYMRNPDHETVAQGLKSGDEVVAFWVLDEGTHYVVRGISTVEPAQQALAIALMQAELRETYQQINQLQNQIANLQNMLRKVLEHQAQ
ncbi:MAG: hypothetical protein ACE5O2_12245 [Armatimonadota bacterium]